MTDQELAVCVPLDGVDEALLGAVARQLGVTRAEAAGVVLAWALQRVADDALAADDDGGPDRPCGWQ